MLVPIAALLGAFALLSNASPLEEQWSKTSQNACAKLASAYTAQTKANPGVNPKVDGQLAYSCMNSVPLHEKEALALLDAILPYVEWQTTLEYLKDPPPGYTGSAVDFRAELNKVAQKVKTASYGSEYAFQADLFRTFSLAHDGHFGLLPDLLSTVVSFQRLIPIVSVSLDGEGLPQVYAKSDIDTYTSKGIKPSALRTINGQDAVTYISDLSQLGFAHDQDALWNSIFYSKQFAAASPGSQGYFAGSSLFGYIWPGASTEIVYQNGTKFSYQTTAEIQGNLTGITDGECIYQRFCTPKPAVAATPAAPAAAPAVDRLSGYPDPIIRSSDGTVSGYYLADQPDVAVLALVSFNPKSFAEFQYVVQQFLAHATKDRKKKLVVDVSSNAGGRIDQGYDTFRQLFPTVVQDGNNRFRHLPATQVIADQYNKVLQRYNSDNIGNANNEAIEMWESPFNYRFDLNTSNQHFVSEKNKIGPYIYHNDNFTNNLRWDFNDLLTINSTYGDGTDVTGYRSRAHNNTQPFAAQDVILLYDGNCDSTCAIFSDFMTHQAGVRTVVFGGRPSRSAMQAVGGTKGVNNLGFGDIYDYVQLAYKSGTPAQQKGASWNQLTQYSLLPMQRLVSTSVNFRDGIPTLGMESGIPAQFIYESADCRMFYTPDMVEDVTAIWKATAQVTWGNKLCAQGSIRGHFSASLAVEQTGAPTEKQRIEVPEFEPTHTKPHMLSRVRSQKVFV